MMNAAATKKILLADDVDLFIHLEKSFFDRENYDLLSAKTGREALAIIQKERPDLVFMDLNMPEMGGSECCSIVKRNVATRDIPIVMVTHADRRDVVEECRKAGCDALLFKPVKRTEFLQAAETLLEKRAASRVPTRISVFHGTNAEETLADYSVNLSTGGLFLETRRILPPGSPLLVRFALPSEERTIVCNARVAWTNTGARPKPDLPEGMGIQFVDMTLDNMDALRTYLTTNALAPAW